jgi:hypothetical protein
MPGTRVAENLSRQATSEQNLKFEYRNPKQTNVQISANSEKSKNPNPILPV